MEVNYTDNPIMDTLYGGQGQFGVPGGTAALPGGVVWTPEAIAQMQNIGRLANRDEILGRPLDGREVTLIVTGHAQGGGQVVVDQVEPRNHLNPQQVAAVRGSQKGKIFLSIAGAVIGVILRAQNNGYNELAYGSWAAAAAMLWPTIESFLVDRCKEPDPVLRDQYQA
ncbi:MAG: hypothetical protein LBJ75_03180 [Puniceicoccales bacterium]|jgi:hypothetical protein|nr:hypothetical protein [Puniceicoccales bacterium]